MPYINADRRDAVRPVCKERPANVGELNFAITCLVHYYILADGLSYAKINDVVGVLEGAKLEFYRAVAGPYENGKRTFNGPISPLDGAHEYQDLIDGLHSIAERVPEPDADTLVDSECTCGIDNSGAALCDAHRPDGPRLKDTPCTLPADGIAAATHIETEFGRIEVPLHVRNEVASSHDLSHVKRVRAGAFPANWADIVVMLDGERVGAVFDVHVDDGWMTIWDGGPNGVFEQLRGDITLASAEATGMAPSMQTKLNDSVGIAAKDIMSGWDRDDQEGDNLQQRPI